MGDCDYCGQPGKEVDCLGRSCCTDCWEEGLKDWTLEKQAELDRLSEETSKILDVWFKVEVPKILAEHGLPPDYKGCICSGCRKPVQSDEHGNWYCDCHDERVGIDPNAPGVVPIPARFFEEVNREVAQLG